MRAIFLSCLVWQLLSTVSWAAPEEFAHRYSWSEIGWGRLQKIEGETVFIQRNDDGKVISVPFWSLDRDDQVHALEIAGHDPLMSKELRPLGPSRGWTVEPGQVGHRYGRFLRVTPDGLIIVMMHVEGQQDLVRTELPFSSLPKAERSYVRSEATGEMASYLPPEAVPEAPKPRKVSKSRLEREKAKAEIAQFENALMSCTKCGYEFMGLKDSCPQCHNVFDHIVDQSGKKIEIPRMPSDGTFGVTWLIIGGVTLMVFVVWLKSQMTE